MEVIKTENAPVLSSNDVVQIRHRVRAMTVECGLSLIEQTKIVTAASELARNMVDYGGGGVVTIDLISAGIKRGVRLTFADRGPGIADIPQAMRDGFTSGGGMGLGLGGAKRLSNEFSIDSAPGEGTRITIIRWRGAA
jgi:serine/threonine-protein kinase RsbT